MEGTGNGRRGRPELPVSAHEGPIAVLAIELRKLREQAGRPAYRDMSRLAHVSASALSEAARGRRWPSWQVVSGYVTACGGELELWRRRWEQLRPATDGEPPAMLPPAVPPTSPSEATPASQPEREPKPVPATGVSDRPAVGRRPLTALWRRVARAGRRAWAVAAAVLLAALLAGLSGASGARPTVFPGSASPHAAAALAEGAPAPVRRRDTLTLRPGQVADLDSMAADWDVRPEPGPVTADIWFGAQDHALHGVADNDIAVLPPDRPDGFWPCAREQDYGVTLAGKGIRPGQVVCALTAARRVAELRVKAVLRTASGAPRQILFDVTVWMPPHRT